MHTISCQESVEQPSISGGLPHFLQTRIRSGHNEEQLMRSRGQFVRWLTVSIPVAALLLAPGAARRAAADDVDVVHYTGSIFDANRNSVPSTGVAYIYEDGEILAIDTADHVPNSTGKEVVWSFANTGVPTTFGSRVTNNWREVISPSGHAVQITHFGPLPVQVVHTVGIIGDAHNQPISANVTTYIRPDGSVLVVATAQTANDTGHVVVWNYANTGASVQSGNRSTTLWREVITLDGLARLVAVFGDGDNDADDQFPGSD
jgi:hypothetical protein